MAETATDTARWNTLEEWSPHLFLLGSVLILAFAIHNGIVFVSDDFQFIDFIYPTVLLGRLAVLLGIAGLSVQVANRAPRFGKLSRVVVAVAVVFTIGLLVLSILEMVGVSTPIIAVFGLGTVVLTAITYALFGGVILRTGAYSTLIGGLLLAATVVLLAVFVGLMVLPTRLVGAVGEGGLFVLFFVIGYFLRSEIQPTDSAEPSQTKVRHG